MTITNPSRRSAAPSPAVRDQVGVDDAQDDDPSADGARVARPLRGKGGLLAAAAVGFVTAQLLPPLGPAAEPAPVRDGPRLAVVVSGQPVFDAAPGPDPGTSAEVALVNTGAEPVRLSGAVADGLALRWSTDQVLAAGEQTAVVLREGNACARLAEQPDGPGLRQELRVTVAASGTASGSSSGSSSGDELPQEVLLPLPASLVGQYDAFARSFCGLPPVAQGLDVQPGPQSLQRGEVLIPVGLVSSTVDRLWLVDVSPTVPGMTVELRGTDGGPLPLPLELPGRYLVDVDIGFGGGVAEIDQYVVSVLLQDDSCQLLTDPAVRTRQLVQLAWIPDDGDDDDRAGLATTTIGDRQEAARQACD